MADRVTLRSLLTQRTRRDCLTLGFFTLGFLASSALLGEPPAASADASAPRDAMTALKVLQPLVGRWKASGSSEKSTAPKQSTLWSETQQWDWDLSRASQPALVGTITNSSLWQKVRIEYDLKAKSYLWTITSAKNEAQNPEAEGTTTTWRGQLTRGRQQEPILQVEPVVQSSSGRIERWTLTILHENRILWRRDSRLASSQLYRKDLQIGATKDGEPFAKVARGPECIVSGGRGTIPVSFEGKTYYVCCSGCKDAFLENPKSWIEAAAKPATAPPR